jgi:hypothetical protein
VSFTFAGFRSRWTIPFSCAASSASAICRAVSSDSTTGIGPWERRAARSSPSTISIARNRTPSAEPTPYTAAIPGWLSEASTRASRSNRAIRSGSLANSVGSTLMATSRPSVVSVARQTTPIPPSPIFSTRR